MKKAKVACILIFLGVAAFLYVSRGQKADFDYRSLYHTGLEITVTLGMTEEEVVRLFEGSADFGLLRETETEAVYVYDETYDAAQVEELEEDEKKVAYRTYFMVAGGKLREIRTYSPYFETLDGISVQSTTSVIYNWPRAHVSPTIRRLTDAWVRAPRSPNIRRLVSGDGRFVKKAEDAQVSHLFTFQWLKKASPGHCLTIKLLSP